MAWKIYFDIYGLLRCKVAPAILKHSESADLLRKSLLPHVWRIPSSKVLSCKHERLSDLLTLISHYNRNRRWMHHLLSVSFLYLILWITGSPAWICLLLHMLLLHQRLRLWSQVLWSAGGKPSVKGYEYCKSAPDCGGRKGNFYD